jgi:PTH1 family peptidyl-tRNA hydrolase
MKIIIAQGNPGRQYARTRHNTGFLLIDALAEKFNGSWKVHDKFKSEIADISITGEKVLLVKPSTFYNETGTAARSIVDFYKLDPATDVLAIHDELALPFGTIRVRGKGSDAGNNGIKSLNAHLGPDYARIRVGVWNERRNLLNDVDFVLSAFSETEMKLLDEISETIVQQLVENFVHGSLEPVSHTIDISA